MRSSHIALLVVSAMLGFGDDHPQAATRRPALVGTASVVTANPGATDAAARVLAAGGSAVDAAIAAQLVLGVVEPQSSGIGGGAIALTWDARAHRLRAFDGLSRSPSGYRGARRESDGFAHSAAAVGVPGTLAVLGMLHERFGSLPWGDLAAPALALAGGGFKVSPYLARSLAAVHGRMTLPVWLRGPDGRAVAEGAMVRNPNLADVLRRISRQGPRAFYVGEAAAVVAALRGPGGTSTMSEADLRGYAPQEREPLCAAWRGGSLCSFPPPSYGGLVVLETLSILDLGGPLVTTLSDAVFAHRFVEAGRLAQEDRLGRVGDPDVGGQPVASLLARRRLAVRARVLDSRRAHVGPLASDRVDCPGDASKVAPSTSQIAVVDARGDAVTMTTTVNTNFGAWITVDGFILNDALTNFAAPEEGVCAANGPAGGKRPETAMAPVILLDRHQRPILLGGSAGGGEIPDYVAQAVLAIRGGQKIDVALDAGHLSSARSPYPDHPGMIELERGRGPASLAGALNEFGHPVSLVPLQSGTGFLAITPRGWTGGADPRRDGTWASVVVPHLPRATGSPVER